MRLVFLSLGFIILTAGAGWLVVFNPGHTIIRLAPNLILEVPTVALLLLAMAFGGLVVVLAAGAAQLKHLLGGWRKSKLRKRNERISDLFRQAVNAKALKRFDEAVSLFQKILSLDPNHIPALLRLGEIHRLQGNVAEAIRLHRKARTLEDKNIEILLALANELDEAKRPEEAAQILNEVQKIEGNSLAVLVKLRDLYVKLGRWEGSHEVQEKILQQPLQAEEAKTEQAWMEGIKYELGCRLLADGQRDRARRFFRGAIKMNRNFIPGYIGLGEVLVDEGKFKDAAELLEKSYEMTSSILLLHRLEDLYIELGQPPKIIRLLQEAIRRDPENTVLRFYLGKLYYRLEMVDEAYETLIALDPGVAHMPDLHKLLGNLYLRKGNVDNAVEEFKKALNLRKRVLVPYYCPRCDYHTSEWSGRCARCGSWNTFEASPIMGEKTAPRPVAKLERA